MYTNNPDGLEYDCYLKFMINRKGISITELSRRTGISRRALTYYITGERLPNNTYRHKIAFALNCHVDDIWVFA